jgi:hypothetical protein
MSSTHTQHEPGFPKRSPRRTFEARTSEAFDRFPPKRFHLLRFLQNGFLPDMRIRQKRTSASTAALLNLIESNEATFTFYVHLLPLLFKSDDTLLSFTTASLSFSSTSRRSPSSEAVDLRE